MYIIVTSDVNKNATLGRGGGVSSITGIDKCKKHYIPDKLSPLIFGTCLRCIMTGNFSRKYTNRFLCSKSRTKSYWLHSKIFFFLSFAFTLECQSLQQIWRSSVGPPEIQTVFPLWVLVGPISSVSVPGVVCTSAGSVLCFALLHYMDT